MVFGLGRSRSSPGSDCSHGEISCIDPVLRPGLSLAELQSGLGRAGLRLDSLLADFTPGEKKSWSFLVAVDARLLFDVVGCCNGSLSLVWDRVMAVHEALGRRSARDS
jgi:hypothetical protein